MQPFRLPLPIPFPIGPANAYLFTTPEPTLVDCGVNTEESWNALETALAQHDLTIDQIQHLIITHPHADHMGMAGRIVENSPATVWVSEVAYRWAVDLENMMQERMDFQHHYLTRIGLFEDRDSIVRGMKHILSFWDEIPTDRVKKFALDDILNFGGYEWQVLYMPGHSNTQTCFYQPDTRQFLAADMLLARTPAPVLEQPLDGSLARVPSFPEFMESMNLLETMDIGTIYPGHGELMDDHRGLIQRLRERIGQRKEECYSLIEAGHHTAAELVDIMYAYQPSGFRFSSVSALIGYLDLLITEGRVVEEEIDGICRYVCQV